MKSKSHDALPGQHYCENHQGNHAHYAEGNCTVCKLQKYLSDIETVMSDQNSSTLGNRIVEILDRDGGWEVQSGFKK